MKPPRSEHEVVDILRNDRPDFLSTNMDVAMNEQYSQIFSLLGFPITKSKVIDYTETERIAYR